MMKKKHIFKLLAPYVPIAYVAPTPSACCELSSTSPRGRLGWVVIIAEHNNILASSRSTKRQSSDSSHGVMAKKQRKRSPKEKKGPPKKLNASRSPQGKQRQERRNGWDTSRRQVIKVPGSAVLRGCKKTKRKLMAHSQLRVITSLFELKTFLTCLVG
ncbi:hypothetical protein HaLaN_00874 [Haematococcus lacustris]|uniref:Uncharacterized protein n=1 Tax=Haematococcus lacustris TaxID=44745 RepID=A0A699Y7X1_HAELA|nr:hypothetical protein HaLaN_00874 [Haematococcus lacustris]